MGLEALKSAERAAGFAMATADDAVDEAHSVTVTPGASEWRSAEPILAPFAQGLPQGVHGPVARRAHATVAEWVKGLFGISGRRAAA
jgi:hypothetical protein